MALKRQTFDNGTQGVTISTANSGTSGDSLSQIIQAGTGAGVYDSAAGLRGTAGAHVTGVLNDNFTMVLSNTSDVSGSAQVYFRILSYPSVGGAFFRLRSSTGNVAIFIIGTTGVVSLQNSTGTNLKNFNSNTPLSLNTTYRLQLQAMPNASTTAGYIAGQLYNDSDVLIDSYSASTVNAGTTLNVQTAQAGKTVTGSDGFDMQFDELGFDTGTTAEIPPVAGGGSGGGGGITNLKRQTFNVGTEGVTISAANSGTSGDAVAILQAGTGDGVYAAAAALRGGKGALVTGVLNDTFTIVMSNTSDVSGTAQIYFRIPAYPSVGGAFFRLRSSTGNIAIFTIGSTGIVSIQNSAGTTLKNFNSNTGLALNTVYRLQLQATPNASTTAGFIAGQLYDDSDVLIDSYSASNVNAGTTLDVQTAQAGKTVTGSDSFSLHIDEFAFGTGSTSEIPPVSAGANQAPTVNAGGDQVDIRPYATVTLTAIASDPDGTTPTVTWVQTSGSPSVALSGSGAVQTFVAPPTRAGYTLTFQATADDGLLSATDTVNITVIPQAEWAVSSGAEVPLQIMEV
jgi:hypothetical protein